MERAQTTRESRESTRNEESSKRSLLHFERVSIQFWRGDVVRNSSCGSGRNEEVHAARIVSRYDVIE